MYPGIVFKNHNIDGGIAIFSQAVRKCTVLACSVREGRIFILYNWWSFDNSGQHFFEINFASAKLRDQMILAF